MHKPSAHWNWFIVEIYNNVILVNMHSYMNVKRWEPSMVCFDAAGNENLVSKPLPSENCM